MQNKKRAPLPYGTDTRVATQIAYSPYATQQSVRGRPLGSSPNATKAESNARTAARTNRTVSEYRVNCIFFYHCINYYIPYRKKIQVDMEDYFSFLLTFLFSKNFEIAKAHTCLSSRIMVTISIRRSVT